MTESVNWQQMHDGLFWPRYAPLLPGRPADGSRPWGPDETIAASLVLARLVDYLATYLRDRHP